MGNNKKETGSEYLLLHPEDLDGLVDMAEAIDVTEQAYGEANKWPIINAPRRRVHSPDGVRLSSFPGGNHGRGVIGVAEHTERIVRDGAIQRSLDREHQICILHDSRNAKLLSVMIGSAMERLIGQTERTALRTGAVRGVRFKHLVRRDAATCGLIGAGGQAVTQLLALKSVRPIRSVRVHTRTPESRKRFAETYGPLFGLDITPVDSAREAIAGADVVLAATSTNVPVVFGEWLEPGQHVTTISASNIELVRGGWLDKVRREIDDNVVLRSDLIAVNSREQIIQDQQGDIYELIDAGRIKLEDIAELGEIVNSRPGRTSDQQITLHINNGGMGAVDVAIAHLAYERAKEAGRGQYIGLPPVTIKSQSR